MMQYYLAPLEGVSGPIYRQTLQAFFPFPDRYYTPFLSPTQDHIITSKQWAEIDPAQAKKYPLIPQFLTNNAENFIWAAKELEQIGYREVNLNLGCPSGTVVKKKKGSGLLGQTDLLASMLDEIYAKCPIAVSVKTRVGLKSEEEFVQLVSLFNQYPICELIVHPRLSKELYRGDVHMELFQYAVDNCKAPLCYNGNLFTPEDYQALLRDNPNLNAVMLGRGAIANPGLIGYLKTGCWIDANRFKQFHDSLYHQYRAAMPGLRPTLFKMRELWCYWACLFEDSAKGMKQIRKADTFERYEASVEALFDSCGFIENGSYFANS